MATKDPVTAISKTETASGQKLKSLLRGLDILELVLERGTPLTVRDIMAALGIPRATAFALVRALEERGYLGRSALPHSYAIGRQLYCLGLAYQNSSDLLKQARPVLSMLAREIGETVQLSVLDQNMNLVVLRDEGPGRIKFIYRVGTRTPVNWSASGTLLISDWANDELRARFPAKLPASPTGRAPTTLDGVIAEIRRFRAAGYAVKVGHAHEHVVTIAAPVRDASGLCCAAVTAIAYEVGLTQDRQKLLVAAVRRGAGEISMRLGARSGHQGGGDVSKLRRRPR